MFDIDEFKYHSPEAKAGILAIRALDDATVLAVARDRSGTEYQAVLAQMGPDTNPQWITDVAAETAYDRGLIDETEFDYLADE